MVTTDGNEVGTHDDEGGYDDSSYVLKGSMYRYPIERYYVFECASRLFQSLLNEVGANRLLEASKDYGNVWGANFVHMARERLGLKGNGVEDVALCYYWAHCGTSFGHIKPLEIRGGRAVVELFACPTVLIDSPPEICIAMSHYISEGLCQAINPECEFIYTHHLSDHDDRCRYIVKKKSDKVNLEDLGRIERTVHLDMSQDEIHMVSGAVCYAALVTFTSVSIDLVGRERTLELALPLAKELGVKMGKRLIEDRGEKGDLDTIREKLDYLSGIQGQVGPPTAFTADGLEREIRECQYMDRPCEVCKQFEAISNGVCEAIDPSYEFVYDRMISKGDPTCHWTVRRKDAPSSVVKEDAAWGDPVKRLTSRFVDGEISEDEFERKMALLRKHSIVK